MAVNKAVFGMLKYEKALGNAISNTLCKKGIQHLHIKFINGMGVYSSIIPPPPKGRKGIEGSEGQGRKSKKSEKEGKGRGKERRTEGKGKGSKKERE